MITRRTLMTVAGATTAAWLLAPPSPAHASVGAAPQFGFTGVYLDAAFVHPVSRQVRDRGEAYFRQRFLDPHAVSPYSNPRNGAVAQFARLINCDAQDVAVVPSTLVAENLVNIALQTGPGAGVVTDSLHYDASLVLYAERQRNGTPVVVVPARDNRVDPADIRRALTAGTRLLAVSLVSSATGFVHDLAEICAIAHQAGVLVYADIIQAAGALPVDVAASGVDFAACGTYKWLMADFGAAFLYVRRDRLERLHRSEVGWRQLRSLNQHVSRFDPEVSAPVEYELKEDAAGFFEVGTPAWGTLATAEASIGSILALGIDTIARHRQPLMIELRQALSGLDGFASLTPADSTGPILSFAVRDAAPRFQDRLRAARVRISVYPNAIRIAPSIYNTPADIQQLIRVLSA